MKNKITTDQWGLERCIMHAYLALDESTKEHFRANPDYNDEFGRWIRNTCELWEHGTAKCVADIIQAYLAKRITSKYLDENVFTHPDLPFDLGNAQQATGADSSLLHPDNCSAIIVEQVFKRLQDGS